jgi:hypothetical protein
MKLMTASDMNARSMPSILSMDCAQNWTGVADPPHDHV